MTATFMGNSSLAAYLSVEPAPGPATPIPTPPIPTPIPSVRKNAEDHTEPHSPAASIAAPLGLFFAAPGHAHLGEMAEHGQEDEDRDDPRDTPHDLSPEAVHDRCVAAVQAWPISAIGRRPADWLAHDLLLHGLLRDARLSYFHRLLKEPESWMSDRVAALNYNAMPGPTDAQRFQDQVRGLQLTALHYLHLRQLDSVHAWIRGQSSKDGGVALRRWRRLWNCPPYGAVYEGRKATNRCCGLVHLCPWCRARAGVRLWQRLQAQVGSRTLYLLRHSTTSHRLEMVRQRRQELRGPAGAEWRDDSFDFLPPAFRPAYLYHRPDEEPDEYHYARPRKVADPHDPLASMPPPPGSLTRC
jgi:hypothetical protein